MYTCNAETQQAYGHKTKAELLIAIEWNDAFLESKGYRCRVAEDQVIELKKELDQLNGQIKKLKEEVTFEQDLLKWHLDGKNDLRKCRDRYIDENVDLKAKIALLEAK